MVLNIIIIYRSVHCYMFIKKWLLSNPLTDCIIIFKYLFHLLSNLELYILFRAVSLQTIHLIAYSLTPYILLINISRLNTFDKITIIPQIIFIAVPFFIILLNNNIKNYKGYTNIYFVENQLFANQICLSPLNTTHQMILQHQPVRPFTSGHIKIVRFRVN